ncbi:YciI family protein [Amycolatopsis pithecellobii]|nr:YciI family protein [Amycolatopsis pithecellobii]
MADTPSEDPRTLDELMGSLHGLQLYMVRMDMPGPVESPLDYLKPHLREHILWLEAQEKAGVLFLSGANSAPEGWDGSGTAILRAGSLAEAEAIAATEPFHREGLRTNTVHGWQLNEGRLRLSISLFADGFEIS